MKTQDLKLFLQVVESGTLSLAASSLNLAKSQISRRISALETELGCQLFHRSEQGLQLTEAGKVFYPQALKITQNVDQTLAMLQPGSQAITGKLRVMIVSNAHAYLIANVIYRFMAQYPNTQFEIIYANQAPNIVQQHIDVIFTFGERLRDSNLIAKPLNSSEIKLYAAPRLLRAKEDYRQVVSLGHLPYIDTKLPHGGRFSEPLLAELEPFPFQSVLTVNDIEASLGACLAGVGMTLLPTHLTADLVAQQRLIPLLDNACIYRCHSWLMFQKQAFMPPLLRSFIDYAWQQLSHKNLQSVAQHLTQKFE
ncbi:LysR family transcriptional regulator [Motilimonas pumila]|uniref:LysR family transcriptional regulator n=1 Tax=Motilimonas pumila TaxID=2303987 RepID=UPI0013143872|nr:LysR family transcriptional regulator [Motilimonas pumila]